MASPSTAHSPGTIRGSVDADLPRPFPLAWADNARRSLVRSGSPSCRRSGPPQRTVLKQFYDGDVRRVVTMYRIGTLPSVDCSFMIAEPLVTSRGLTIRPLATCEQWVTIPHAFGEAGVTGDNARYHGVTVGSSVNPPFQHRHICSLRLGGVHVTCRAFKRRHARVVEDRGNVGFGNDRRSTGQSPARKTIR